MGKWQSLYSQYKGYSLQSRDPTYLLNDFRVKQVAPAFTTEAVLPDGTFKKVSLSDYKGSYVVLFFYPLDFTFVCPTELIELSNRMEEFKKLNCHVLGVSVDSKYSHLAWSQAKRDQGGLGGLQYPLLEDVTRKISTDYDVLMPEDGHTLRGTFIIDKEQKIRVIQMNDPPVGRSVDEILRLVEAVRFNDEHGEVCPVNWKKGKPTMKDNPTDSKKYFNAIYSDTLKRQVPSPVKGMPDKKMKQ